MKRMILMSCLLVCAVPFAARADHEIDWNDWFEGNVQVRLRLDRGEGALYGLGQPVGLKLQANEDAYHLVYGIDTDGYVRLLFPRPWEDDGWLFAHEELFLQAQQLAWPADRWGSGGIVYVEAVASPVPFDYSALGVVFRSGYAGWVQDGRPFRVEGDPFLAFNDVHRILFPDWEQAVFAVDYTYFYVNQVREAPRYLGYTYQRVYVAPPAPVFSVGLRFVWHWEFGRRYCRPVYPRYYVRGRHVVYHPLHGHHHVIYRAPAPPPPSHRPRSIPWVVPERKRVIRDTPVVRQRSGSEPPRQRQRVDQPHVERTRAPRSVAEISRRVVGTEREATARPTARPAVVKRQGTARPALQPPAAKRTTALPTTAKRTAVKREAAAAAQPTLGSRLKRLLAAKPAQAKERPKAAKAVERREASGKQDPAPQSKPKRQSRETKEKKSKRR